jgi:hypothetical protein
MIAGVVATNLGDRNFLRDPGDAAASIASPATGPRPSSPGAVISTAPLSVRLNAASGTCPS